MNFSSDIQDNQNLNFIFSPYSNPSVNFINIPFSILGGKNYALCIYDINGKEISKLDYLNMPKGSYKEIVDISIYESGTYFASLKEDNRIVGSTSFTVLKN